MNSHLGPFAIEIIVLDGVETAGKTPFVDEPVMLSPARQYSETLYMSLLLLVNIMWRMSHSGICTANFGCREQDIRDLRELVLVLAERVDGVEKNTVETQKCQLLD